MDNEQPPHALDRVDTPSVPSAQPGQSVDEDAGDARRLATIAASPDPAHIESLDSVTIELQAALQKRDQRIDDLGRSIDRLRAEIRRLMGVPDEPETSREDLQWLVDRLLEQAQEIERRGHVIVTQNEHVADRDALAQALQAANQEAGAARQARDAALRERDSAHAAYQSAMATFRERDAALRDREALVAHREREMAALNQQLAQLTGEFKAFRKSRAVRVASFAWKVTPLMRGKKRT
jgi:chromosome segregation ATPase